MDQTIRFCTTEDGVRIAYATMGSGLPIVRPGHWLTHLEYDLKSPIFSHLVRGLSEQHQFVRYDPRGTGLSDRNVSAVSPELWLKDLEAVVDDLRLERFALLGLSQGGPTAIRYAVKHPEKVTHLVLYGSYARGRLHRHEGRYTPEMLEALCTLIVNGWGSDNESYRELFSALYVPSGNRESMRWMNDLERVSASPEMAARYLRALADIDIVDLLPQVRIPTLVLHRKGDKAVAFNVGRELAAGIPGAKFVPMEGESHILLEDDPARETFFDELRRFLGDKTRLVSKSALVRHGRNWKAATSHIHHAIEPYYMIAVVASAVVGAIAYVVARFT